MEPIRRADIVWKGDETREFDVIEQQAQVSHQAVNDYIKQQLRQNLN